MQVAHFSVVVNFPVAYDTPGVVLPCTGLWPGLSRRDTVYTN